MAATRRRRWSTPSRGLQPDTPLEHETTGPLAWAPPDVSDIPDNIRCIAQAKVDIDEVHAVCNRRLAQGARRIWWYRTVRLWTVGFVAAALIVAVGLVAGWWAVHVFIVVRAFEVWL